MPHQQLNRKRIHFSAKPTYQELRREWVGFSVRPEVSVNSVISCLDGAKDAMSQRCTRSIKPESTKSSPISMRISAGTCRLVHAESRQAAHPADGSKAPI